MNEKLVGFVACASVGVSTFIAFFWPSSQTGCAAATASAGSIEHLLTWIQVGNVSAPTSAWRWIRSQRHLRALHHLRRISDSRLRHRLHARRPGFLSLLRYLNLFMFAMLTLVLADNFLLMFVGWEGVGLCSYLLIGYYIEREEAGDAAKKAFITNRIGDWGFVLGIISDLHYIRHDQLLRQDGYRAVSDISLQLPRSSRSTGLPWSPAASRRSRVLLFIGATGKCAQIPLFVWLPDAMAGPTPVSALIHAATMVTAGVYMIVASLQRFIHSRRRRRCSSSRSSARRRRLFAATIGLAQNDIKKVLAYSTVSQLGYMFLACGVGAFVAAIFHVITHAFFKALLFLGSGSVIHGMHHEQDMRRMGGLKKYMPITFATMFAAGWRSAGSHLCRLLLQGRDSLENLERPAALPA